MKRAHTEQCVSVIHFDSFISLCVADVDVRLPCMFRQPVWPECCALVCVSEQKPLCLSSSYSSLSGSFKPLCFFMLGSFSQLLRVELNPTHNVSYLSARARVCVLVKDGFLKMHIFHKTQEETERGEKKNTACVCCVSWVDI